VSTAHERYLGDEELIRCRTALMPRRHRLARPEPDSLANHRLRDAVGDGIALTILAL